MLKESLSESHASPTQETFVPETRSPEGVSNLLYGFKSPPCALKPVIRTINRIIMMQSPRYPSPVLVVWLT